MSAIARSMSSRAAVVVALVRGERAHPGDRVGVARVEGEGPLGRLLEAGFVALEEKDVGEHDPARVDSSDRSRRRAGRREDRAPASRAADCRRGNARRRTDWPAPPRAPHGAVAAPASPRWRRAVRHGRQASDAPRIAQHAMRPVDSRSGDRWGCPASTAPSIAPARRSCPPRSRRCDRSRRPGSRKCRCSPGVDRRSRSTAARRCCASISWAAMRMPDADFRTLPPMM